eukprot:12935353-Prorocentrum_lima.AAC.1
MPLPSSASSQQQPETFDPQAPFLSGTVFYTEKHPPGERPPPEAPPPPSTDRMPHVAIHQGLSTSSASDILVETIVQSPPVPEA